MPVFHLLMCSNYIVCLLAVALAFRAQLVAFVPTTLHDIDVDILVTADGMTACSSRGKVLLSNNT